MPIYEAAAASTARPAWFALTAYFSPVPAGISLEAFLRE
jgi:hypothetical protein